MCSSDLVVGRTMVVQGKPHTIIGVTPPEFFGMKVGEAADFYLPVSPARAPAGSNAPSLDWVEVIGRLKPGVRASHHMRDKGCGVRWIIENRRSEFLQIGCKR